jgi:hypothetical protein
MSYIGNTSTTQAFTPAVDYFSGNASTTAFTLSKTIASVAQVQVTVANVPQNPSSAYTISGQTLTFTSAPPSGTNNIYVYYTSPITQVIAPGQNTVYPTSLSTTNALYWDTNANVGIGNTSPDSSNKLQVTGDIGLTWATDKFIGMKFGAGTSYKMGLVLKDTTRECKVWSQSSDSDDKITFYTGPTPSERMRIDSSGNVGIGGTPTTAGPRRTLTVNGISGADFYLQYGGTEVVSIQATSSTAPTFNYPASGSLAFQNGGTERMRIDSSGNLLIGQTAQSSGEKLGLTVSGSNTFAYFRSTGTSGNPVMLRLTTGNLSGGIGTGAFVYCDDGGSAKFFVAGSGVVNSTSTSITAISDSRLKENVRDLETGLNTVLALKPRRFDWKQGEGTDQKDVAGFIAQEVETVLPELVGEWKHDPDSETIYKSLAMGNMIPTMVKAIQELKAINDTQAETINALTARIEALENK